MSECICGAGIRKVDGGFEIRPHEMGCSVLRKIATRGKTHCTSCDVPLIFEQGGDVWYCPDGHSSGMKGNAMLDFLDTAGSGWMREELDDTLDADEIG